VLEAIGVHKTYPGEVHALAGVDLFVSEGETVALVGESGSGKTTLLRMFNRLAEPTEGEIRIGGRAARKVDPIRLRRSTGYVQQEGGLLPHWSVRRNVTLVPVLLGWEQRRARRRSDELLEAVGLDPQRYANRYPLELSGGERQRVAFARALAADPDVVLLDEPFGALDALTRLDIQDQFLAIKRSLRKTMVMVTHDLGEAFRLADRVAVMKDGLILQQGRPAELRSRPEAGYVTELLDRVAP
jgi:osmoprotectant transport system ATP-binding protein